MAYSIGIPEGSRTRGQPYGSSVGGAAGWLAQIIQAAFRVGTFFSRTQMLTEVIGPE